jgi:plasmid stabilization system protein ParE
MAGERLEIHPEALEEIKSAVRWYRERSESAAVRFVEEFDEAVALIAQSPNRWPGEEMERGNWSCADSRLR